MHMRRPSRGDGGFTLIELLIVILILGVISLPIANVVIAYFSNATQTTLRLNESHDAQIVNTYWQRDVSSIGIRGTFDSAQNTFPLQQSVNVAFPCSLPLGVSSPIVVLAWDRFDSAGAPTMVSVAYATRASGTALVRLHCTASTLDSVATISHNLHAVPQVTCSGPGGSSCVASGASVPTTVTLSLNILDPADKGSAYAVSLSGQRRQTT
jgi:prepilin-type N-terminal cleavage/methylation domain-containing protein